MAGGGYSVTVWVDLSEIDPRPASDARARVDDEAIQEYAESLDRVPPISLVFDAEAGHHWTEDGHHRILAARAKKEKQIRAVVRNGSYLDAFPRACQANQTHGVRVTNEDKRHRVVVALRHPEMKRWSNSRIADACGVSHVLVGRLRPDAQPETVSGCDAPTVGRDGKSRRKPRKPQPRPADDQPAEDTAQQEHGPEATTPDPDPSPVVTPDPAPESPPSQAVQDDVPEAGQAPEPEPEPEPEPASAMTPAPGTPAFDEPERPDPMPGQSNFLVDDDPVPDPDSEPDPDWSADDEPAEDGFDFLAEWRRIETVIRGAYRDLPDDECRGAFGMKLELLGRELKLISGKVTDMLAMGGAPR